MKAFMSQTYYERCEAWPSRAEQEARAILAMTELEWREVCYCDGRPDLHVVASAHVEPCGPYALQHRLFSMAPQDRERLAESLAAFLAEGVR